MTSLHMHCTRSERILLCRLDLKSHFSDWILTILTENALILRGSRAAVFELRSWLKILDCCAGKYFFGSLFNLGVCCFSGWKSSGDITISNIGYKNKKDFRSNHAESWREEFHF